MNGFSSRGDGLSDGIDERPVWDETVAESVVGKCLLVGLSYLEADGALIEQQQFFGTVVSADLQKGNIAFPERSARGGAGQFAA
jgi:hypothetical protein